MITLSLIDNLNDPVTPNGNTHDHIFISIVFVSSPGNGTVDVVKTWPRFCSFQNSGANLTGNDTQVLLARRFCAKELDSVQTSTSHHVIPIFLHLFLLEFLYFLFH